MKRYLGAILMIVFFVGPSIHAQDSQSLLLSFQKNFTRGSLTTKVQILQDASQLEGEEMGPLYKMALEFILNNADLIGTDTQAQQLSLLSARLIRETDYKDALPLLLQLYETDKNTEVRVEILKSLAALGKGNDEVVSVLNVWLDTQNSLRQGGGHLSDLQVINQCVSSLGTLGSEQSFPIIFSTMVLGYSTEITGNAERALFEIPGDFDQMIINVIQNSPILEKVKALDLAIAYDQLSGEQKATIAEAALRVGISSSAADFQQQSALRQLRYAAVRVLTANKWSRATDAVIKHFDMVLLEMERGEGTKAPLLEAIACLGAMGTHEAAVRLNLYLELIHTYTENGKPYDEQIVLAVINNLGILGDKVAIDNLLYTGYLKYNNTIKKAARDALKQLKI